MGQFFKIALFLSLTLTYTLADVSSLQDHNQDHLDPLSNQDQELTTNNQDKRTICSTFNKCGSTSSYVKRLVIKKPQKTVLLRPVGIRPVIVGGYRYTKPKFQLKLKAPTTVHGGWKPVIATQSKPAVEVVKPANHIDVIHNYPVPHLDQVAPSVLHQNFATPHSHIQPDHIHLHAAVQPEFVHLSSLLPAPHVDQLHQVNVQHGNHFDSFTHLDHLQPEPQPQPIVPVAQPVVQVASPPVVHSPTLFEVTRPNLGVLPLGARFPHPVLKEVAPPQTHIAPVPLPASPVPLHEHILPHHHHTPAIQGIIQTPIGLPAIAPQPGVSVEYHGTRNFLALAPHLHFGALHAHQQLPVEHPAHNFAIQQDLPFPHSAHGFVTPQQALPFEHGAHAFSTTQQALPHDHATQFAVHQQLPHAQQQPHFQQYQDIPQGQLPLEGEHQFHEQFGSTLNFQNQGQVIQPGQSDLQIPYHLPQHAGWEQEESGQEESRGNAEQTFRPSPQLQAPYVK
ncbi:uncharacterized protein LOC126738168 [Anthonomus grandis grandis]|uniref:uncharacterized protein LOC126738168 n=1 Tax=Anthonomus grandis grandis TaxID=2921223 RepID=UPI002166415B|nr:uncharacterized protein LOC126738168 [Anthonomus grandis grandis]